MTDLPVLSGFRVVDLTQTLGPETVMWPGTPPVAPTVEAQLDPHGVYLRRLDLSEHSGTHLDAPSHFAAGGAHVHEIPAEQLVRPLVVIDIAAEVGADPDAELTVAQVQAHEAAHGPVAAGSVVALRTGWSEHRADAARYAGVPAGQTATPRFPGFGLAAARLLVEQRGVVALGTDSLGIDPGRATGYPVHAQVSLPRGVWHLENLVDLHLVPPVGALVVVGVVKLRDGSGAPARVLALVA